jgi:hypothetical protein
MSVAFEETKKGDCGSPRALRDVLQTHFREHSHEIGGIIQQMSEVAVGAHEKTYPVMTSLVAFGDNALRYIFIMCICKALQPTVFHSAYIKDVETREFEVILMSRKNIGQDDLEHFLDLFNMSVCVIPFSRYMGPDMLEGISRILVKGRHHFGNFHTQQAKTVRRYYQCKKRSKQVEDKMHEVRRVTGMSFTPENMIHINTQLMDAQRVNFNLMQILDRGEP